MEEFESSFTAWLEPAGVITSAEVVDARKQTAEWMRDEHDDRLSLVLGAFGRLHEDVMATTETKLQEFDPTHVIGKRHLIELLAAAACMSAMEQDSDAAIDIALLVRSAEFIGFAPAIPGLIDSARQSLDRASRRARARVPLPRVRPRSRQAIQEDDAVALQSMSTRLDRMIAHFDLQLALLNEEVDVLWWARRGRSDAGRAWSDMGHVDRAVIATSEVARLISNLPVTGAIFEVLGEVADAPDRKTVSLLDAGRVIATASFELPSSPHPLVPLLSSGSIAAGYRETSQAGVVETQIQLDPERKVRVADIPEQLLREVAIAKRIL